MISQWPEAVYLETSILRKLPIDIINAEFLDLLKICLQRKTTIAVPEVALDELLYARKLDLKANIERLKRISKHKIFMFSELPIEWRMNEEAMIKALEDNIRSIFKAHLIKTIRTPNLDVKKLLKMAIEKNPPFQKKGEKGFRDAAIMYTIIEYAKVFHRDGLNLLISNDGVFRDETVREHFKAEGVSFDVTTSVADTVKHLEGLLEKEWAAIRTQRSEVLKSFLEENIGEIVNCVRSNIATDLYFISSVFVCPYPIQSIKSIEVRKIHSITPGALEEGKTEGKVKISFSAAIDVTFMVWKRRFDTPQILYDLADQSSHLDAASGIGIPKVVSDLAEHSATLAAASDVDILSIPDVGGSNVTIRDPWTRESDYQQSTYYIPRSKLNEYPTEADVSFEGTAHLKVTNQHEKYSDLTLDRTFPHFEAV